MLINLTLISKRSTKDTYTWLPLMKIKKKIDYWNVINNLKNISISVKLVIVTWLGVNKTFILVTLSLLQILIRYLKTFESYLEFRSHRPGLGTNWSLRVRFTYKSTSGHLWLECVGIKHSLNIYSLQTVGFASESRDLEISQFKKSGLRMLWF